MTEMISGRPQRNPETTEKQSKSFSTVVPESKQVYLHNPEYQQAP